MRTLSKFAISIALGSQALGTVSQALGAVQPVDRTQIPLTFEPNQGQADAKSEYVARGAGYYLTLDGTGSRMLLRIGKKAAEVRMRIVGDNGTSAQPGARLTGTQPLRGHSAYFRGADSSKWLTNVPNFAQVRANQVYPGIDLVYYGNQARLEYDFVVAPGADASRIRLHFDGVESLKIDAAGNLLLATTAGTVVHHKPALYQTLANRRRPVEGSFRVETGNDVSFQVGRYDPTATLTIDPTLVYSSFLGGTDSESGNSVATDGAANMYMTGVTYSTPAGDGDVLVRKISADGTTFLYTADLGGSGDDFGNGIAVDVYGSAYIGGRTTSTDFPVNNAYQNKNRGLNNVFVLKLDPAASNLVFSTYLGGNNDDRGYSIALDSQGSVYIAGASTSTDFPTSDGAFQRSNRGGIDAFVTKFSSTGAGIYSTLLGGGSDDRAWAIAVDAKGNAYVTGDTYSDSFPNANAPYQRSRHGGLEAFVSELNADGTQLPFSTFIGGSGDDTTNGIALDPFGNIYVVGSTTSDKDFSVPGRSFNTGYNGGKSDIFVAKYSPNGQDLLWTTFLGSHGGDYGNGIAVDNSGNVYVAGDTDSDQYPVTKDATQGSRAGGVDAVFSVLDTNGLNLLYSTFYGGSGNDSAVGIALDQYAQVYLTGQTSSADLPTSKGVVQPLPGGGDSDAFLAKMSVFGSAIPGTSNSTNPTPASVVNPESSFVSAFGRGMVSTSVEGKFNRRLQTGGAAIEPAAVEPSRFERMGRNGGAKATR
jgi:hypothetical protein